MRTTRSAPQPLSQPLAVRTQLSLVGRGLLFGNWCVCSYNELGSISAGHFHSAVPESGWSSYRILLPDVFHDNLLNPVSIAAKGPFRLNFTRPVPIFFDSLTPAPPAPGLPCTVKSEGDALPKGLILLQHLLLSPLPVQTVSRMSSRELRLLPRVLSFHTFANYDLFCRFEYHRLLFESISPIV